MSSPTSACDELFIRRTTVSNVRAWLSDPKGLLFIVGECGSGKTALAIASATDANMEPLHSTSVAKRDKDELNRLMSIARSPSFTNQKRVLILDDADSISNSGWTALEKQTPLPFPCMLLTHDIASIPWSVRRNARVIDLPRPSEHHLREWIETQGTEHTSQDIDRIVEQSRSWRQVQYNLKMTPPGRAPPTSEDVIIQLSHNEQPTAVLSGNQRGPTNVSVLRIIEAAEYNHAPPGDVRRAQWLESRTWFAQGLGKVSRAFAERLRSQYRDVQRVPFRKRRKNR